LIVPPPIQGLAGDAVDSLCHLCAQSHVELAVTFGSRARGDGSATSDLDILVLPPASLPFDLLGFEAEAQRIVGRPRVDVTMLHPALSSALAWEALREAIVLWEPIPGTYEREREMWNQRFLSEASRRRDQARRLMQTFRCP
jgi:predicted nucleotidyltransferase